MATAVAQPLGGLGGALEQLGVRGGRGRVRWPRDWRRRRRCVRRQRLGSARSVGVLGVGHARGSAAGSTMVLHSSASLPRPLRARSSRRDAQASQRIRRSPAALRAALARRQSGPWTTPGYSRPWRSGPKLGQGARGRAGGSRDRETVARRCGPSAKERADGKERAERNGAEAPTARRRRSRPAARRPHPVGAAAAQGRPVALVQGDRRRPRAAHRRRAAADPHPAGDPLGRRRRGAVPARRSSASCRRSTLRPGPRLRPRGEGARVRGHPARRRARARREDASARSCAPPPRVPRGRADADGARHAATSTRYSRKLYGSPKDKFPDGKTSVRDMGFVLYELLTAIGGERARARRTPRDITADMAALELNARFDRLLRRRGRCASRSTTRSSPTPPPAATT